MTVSEHFPLTDPELLKQQFIYLGGLLAEGATLTQSPWTGKLLVLLTDSQYERAHETGSPLPLNESSEPNVDIDPAREAWLNRKVEELFPDKTREHSRVINLLRK